MAESATLTELTVKIPKEALARVEALAAQTGQNTSDIVGEVFAEYLDYLEWKVATIAEAVKQADAGGPFVEHERVVAWVNSWGTDDELPPPEGGSSGFRRHGTICPGSVCTSPRATHVERRSVLREF